MTFTLLLLLALVSGGNLALGFFAGRYLGLGSQAGGAVPADKSPSQSHPPENG